MPDALVILHKQNPSACENWLCLSSMLQGLFCERALMLAVLLVLRWSHAGAGVLPCPQHMPNACSLVQRSLNVMYALLTRPPLTGLRSLRATSAVAAAPTSRVAPVFTNSATPPVIFFIFLQRS